MLINHLRPIKCGTSQAFAHFRFEIIRCNSNTTPREDPNILMSFFTADMSRYPATGEVNTWRNLKSKHMGHENEY